MIIVECVIDDCDKSVEKENAYWNGWNAWQQNNKVAWYCSREHRLLRNVFPVESNKLEILWP